MGRLVTDLAGKTDGSVAKVFISHSTSDRELVERELVPTLRPAVCHNTSASFVRVLDAPASFERVLLALIVVRRQNRGMSTAIRTQRRYDHRLKQIVRATGNIDVALESGVPKSTAYGWLTGSRADVVTINALDDVGELQREIILLRRRNIRLIAILRLIITVMKTAAFSLNRVRFPEECSKLRVLRALDQARDHFMLRTILRVIGLTHGRFLAWSREQCGLEDRESCQRSSPQQLTAAEVNAIKEMVMSEAYRHVPTGTLARLAERLGKVFASASTWYRLVRLYRWRRPRRRVHPAKPTIGVRATKANQIWHVDTTVLRLLNGGRVYLHAVIDNYSRRILSWRVLDGFHPAITARLLLDAANAMNSGSPIVVVDGGVENYNAAVDEVINSGVLKRVLAQTEIRSSNSLIESWWRVLKHQWLFLNPLDSLKTVDKLAAFYVEQHNTHLPHSAFQGQTPDEMFFGTGAHIPQQLETARLAARSSRLEANRSRSCQKCERLVTIDD